jgi:hypothetical protein
VTIQFADERLAARFALVASKVGRDCSGAVKWGPMDYRVSSDVSDEEARAIKRLLYRGRHAKGISPAEVRQAAQAAREGER